MLGPGTRLGPYEILSAIGAGGMGEVYRATDTTLGRQVAIKVLPDAFAQDAERLARFEREAKTLAALNHPHIAQIYGLEKSSGMQALVMELVEGEDLSQRIARGPIPLDEALPIARQIAEALEAAHEQGIIHRDLKPANIKVTPDGVVKVLDFGLAKLAERSGSPPSNLSLSPTITSPAMMTGVGVLLGTAAYMSPEQARGKAADRRTDIWAFGAVLYEMLTARRAFEDEDVSLTLSKVLQRDPDWSALRPDVPLRVRQVLRICLEKDPKQRAQAMGDVRLALEGAFETGDSQAAAPVVVARWRRVAALLTVGALVAAVALWSWGGKAPSAAAPTRVSVVLPANRPVAFFGSPNLSLALSPDGTQLVYVGRNLDAPADQPGGRLQLQLRSLGTLAVRDLPGTTGAREPFFSPDGQWVGFFTFTGELKKIALAGGKPVTLLEKINGSPWGFGVWTADNTIIFGTPAGGDGLRRVSADGGEATALTTLDAAQGEGSHFIPALVPSSRAVLFDVRRYRQDRKPRIDAVMLDSGARRVVVENADTPIVLSSGHLVFQRDEAILIAPFDATRLTLTGPAVPLIDDVRRDSPTGGSSLHELAVSRSGTLAYVPAIETASSLGLVSRDGLFERIGPPPDSFDFPRMSPNGKYVAFVVSRSQAREVHLYDLARGNTTKLTQDGSDYMPSWSPDSRSLALVSQKKNANGIFLKNLDGSERLLVALPAGVTVLRSPSWSPDGKLLAYTIQTGSQHDIWVLTMGDTPTTKPFLNSAASEYSPKFSPDGRWLAYASNESGRSEVYVRGYPKGERYAVSTGGGDAPVWRPDGREIFFEGPYEGVQKLMAVSITSEGDSLRLAQPVPLFDMRVPGPTGVIEQYASSGNIGAEYDILPDGKRFVMIRGADPQGAREIVLVQNWFEELKRRVPTK